MRLAIATLLTLGNAICGFVGIALLAFRGGQAIVVACLLVFGAWLFDMIDGIVARRLGVEGPLGAVLDSLCDVVSFGLLPAVILLDAGWEGTARIFAITAGAIYLSAAILRLGRYTVKAMLAPATGPRLWFEGLSSPAAAMCFGAAVLASAPGLLQAILAVLLALLMVSKVPYPDLVKFYLERRLPLWSLLVPSVAMIVDWRRGVAAILAFYICIGPAAAARNALKR
jgi:CDP-diacylglycerol--serine O-phosphatidyltransferase